LHLGGGLLVQLLLQEFQFIDHRSVFLRQEMILFSHGWKACFPSQVSRRCIESVWRIVSAMRYGARRTQLPPHYYA
jgi:hypothetical protein